MLRLEDVVNFKASFGLLKSSKQIIQHRCETHRADDAIRYYSCHNVHVLDGNSVVSNKHAYAENVYMSANLLGMPIMAVSARVAPVALLGGLLAFTVLQHRTFEA